MTHEICIKTKFCTGQGFTLLWVCSCFGCSRWYGLDSWIRKTNVKWWDCDIVCLTRLSRKTPCLNVLLKPKKRAYIQIKYNYSPDICVMAYLSRSQRCVVAELRTGILPLATVNGRFKNIQVCESCDLKLGTKHFMVHIVLIIINYKSPS